MTEQWKPCPGYEGLYEISSLGRVRTLAEDHRGHKPCIGLGACDERGRRTMWLRNDKGELRREILALLVAWAFLPEREKEDPFEPYEIWFKNDDPTDVRPENLEWITLGVGVTRREKQTKEEEAYLDAFQRVAAPPSCVERRRAFAG